MSRPLKARSVYAEMRHAIGGSTAREIREQDLLNDVLNEVTSMHEWAFLERGEAHVDLRGQVAFSAFSWTAATKTLFDPTPSALFTDYTRVPTDRVQITAGGTAGFYGVESKTDNNTLVLSESIFATDLAGTVGGTVIPRVHLLPSDFRSLISAGFEAETSSLALASPQVTNAIGRYPGNGDFTFSGSVEWVSETQVGLRLAPSPVNTAKSAISIVYKRRLALVGTDGQDIDAPEFVHRLIKGVARALVRGLEMPDTYGSFDEQLVKIRAGAVFAHAVAADGAGQVEIGPIVNGHVPRYPVDWPDTTIRSVTAGGP